MDKNKKSRIYLIVLMIAIFVVYTYRQNLPRQVHITGVTMGTIAYNVKYIDKKERQFKPQIDSLLKDFNQSLSTYIPSSDISVFNKTGKVDFNFPYFYDVLSASKVIYENTGGAFDPTVGPLIDAWGFGDGEMIGPDSTQVDSLLQYVGFDKIDFTENQAISNMPNMKLSFSAIAKGQAIDVVADWLETQDLNNYMVEIGGEVRAKGQNLEDETWTIGIEQPNEQRIGGLFDAIQLNDQGMATSGNYRNFRIVNGKKVAHTIDPTTGFPKMQTLLSATILAPSCMLADGYATACMVMGLEGSKKLVESNPELEGYFIYANEAGEMVTYVSSGLKGKTLKEAQ